MDDTYLESGKEGTSEGTEHVSPDSANIAPFEHCMRHKNKEVLHYCENHKIGCCVMCTVGHEQCELVPLEDIFYQFSMISGRVQYIIDSIENKNESLKLHSKRIKTNIQYNEIKIRKCFDRIRAIVDKTENEILNELYDLREDEVGLVTSYLNENVLLKEQLEQIKEEGLHLRGVNTCTTTARKTTPTSSGTVSNQDVLEFNKRHEGTLTFIGERLNYIEECTKEIDVNFIKRDDTVFDQINLDLRKVFRISSLHVNPPVSTQSSFVKCGELRYNGSIMDVKIIPGGEEELLFISRNPNSLKYLHTDGIVSRSTDLPDPPSCLCVYSNTVAITFLGKSTIKLYELADFTDLRQIHLSSTCAGICRVDNNFMVAMFDEGTVNRIHDSGDVIYSSEKLFNQPTCIATSQNFKKILVSDTGNNRVMVLNANLKRVLFTLSHADLLYPRGLCASVKDRIYVSSKECNCVIEFTFDGRYVSTIFSSEHGIVSPMSLCYDSRDDLLAVVSLLSNTANIKLYINKV